MDKTPVYIARINRVIDFIESNLTQEISLDDLVPIADLSKYHFHRIFRSFTNESLYSFINRLRIERSAAFILLKHNSITDIAFSCGFNDSSTFSRAFKKQFNMSATDWRKRYNSKIHQDFNIKTNNNISMKSEKGCYIKPLHIEERYTNDLYVAYVRHIGAYYGDSKLFLSLHHKLMLWANTVGVLEYPKTKDIVIYHDSINITERDNLRISLGVTVPKDTKVSGEIGSLCISKSKYISCKFEVQNNEYGKAWTSVFRNILPQRGLQPADGSCFEEYTQDCYDKDKNITTVNICVPIKTIE